MYVVCVCVVCVCVSYVCVCGVFVCEVRMSNHLCVGEVCAYVGVSMCVWVRYVRMWV